VTPLATLKHIASKNADYGAAEQYLTFENDEFTGKPILDGNGRLVPHEDYRITALNCGGEDFVVACMRANLRYGKNQQRDDVKSHHYIISFDPRGGPDHSLTIDKTQKLGERYCREHLPGHQALVCTHPDGHNHSGNKAGGNILSPPVNLFADNLEFNQAHFFHRQMEDERIVYALLRKPQIQCNFFLPVPNLQRLLPQHMFHLPAERDHPPKNTLRISTKSLVRHLSYKNRSKGIYISSI